MNRSQDRSLSGALNIKAMYKLIKEDGINNSVINDKQFHSLAGVSVGLYEYDGPDPSGPDEDSKNAAVQAGNLSDGFVDQNVGTGDGERIHRVTQEDLMNNPDFVKEGVKVGDTISFSEKFDGDIQDADDAELLDHELTEKDIDDNPLLKEEGKKPGDVVKYPKSNRA